MVVVRRIKAMIMGSADIDYLIVHLLTEVTTSICHFKIKLIWTDQSKLLHPMTAIQPSIHPSIQPSKHPTIQPNNHPSIEQQSIHLVDKKAMVWSCFVIQWIAADSSWAERTLKPDNISNCVLNFILSLCYAPCRIRRQIKGLFTCDVICGRDKEGWRSMSGWLGGGCQLPSSSSSSSTSSSSSSSSTSSSPSLRLSSLCWMDKKHHKLVQNYNVSFHYDLMLLLLSL